MSDLRPRSIKVSDDDWEELRRRAGDEGITAYLIRRGLSDERDEIRDLRRELKTIGKLASQIVTRAS